MSILNPIKRTVFISHYKGDRVEVDTFISDFKSVFIPKVLGANDNDDFINSTDTNYVMQKIREKYLGDSTITIVLIGKCTHSRRYVDWEIKSSLQQGLSLPNGLIGILLPSQGGNAYLPPRFNENWNKQNTEYARFYAYPQNATILSSWIQDAFEARTGRANLIKNSNEMMKYNAKCNVCEETH